jgi:endonuclease/exonuclease/phosphatase family metal-dependent hydrolase
MPFYNDLRPQSDYEKRDFSLVFPGLSDDEKIRIISNLVRLKDGLAQHIAPRKTDENLLVASWNIKEFGHTQQRLPEAYFYIAEIISCFDLVAIQEVKSTLKDLQIVMRILGSDWEYLVNDITDGNDGNSERSAYLYNRKRLRLSGLAGELVLWPEITEGSSIKQLKRSPYITGFRAGWKTFALINLHLHPGDDADDVTFRHEEIRLLLAALAEKTREHWTQNLILCGDFNLYQSKDAAAIRSIEDAGYSEIDGIKGKDTNASQTEAYDRLFVRKNAYFAIRHDHGGEVGGVFDPFDIVFREEEHAQYKQEMIDVYGGSSDLENDSTALEHYFMRYWRRNQISDHFPIWFELGIDSSVEFLQQKKSELMQ